MNISVCMIVRNEETVLKKSLPSIVAHVPELIIIDTGSIDSTKKIAYEFTDKVYDYTWNNNFAAARNFSLEKATNDWILVLDADEIVTSFAGGQLQSALSQKQDFVGRIKIVNITADSTGESRYTERVSRLFNREYFHYEGTIHEQIVSRNASPFERVPAEITVEHLGYTPEALQRTNKLARNIKLLETALSHTPDDPYLIYQMGKAHYLRKDFAKAAGCFIEALNLPLNYGLEYVEDLIETYGYALINSQDYAPALNCRKYAGYYGASADYLFLMGHIYLNNGMFAEAVENFRKCLGRQASKAEGVTSYLANYNLGVIYECLGESAKARQYYLLCGQYPPAQKRFSLI